MKANEFVKAVNSDAVKYFQKNGLKKSKEVVKASSNALVDAGDGAAFHVSQLKRLVESYELVESNGGYNSVKAMFEDLHCMDLDDWNNDLELLARAMSDVESCQ